MERDFDTIEFFSPRGRELREFKKYVGQGEIIMLQKNDNENEWTTISVIYYPMRASSDSKPSL